MRTVTSPVLWISHVDLLDQDRACRLRAPKLLSPIEPSVFPLIS